ncbi:MAG TPA: hypothetical protein VFB50_11650 [Chloroflexota bacterium]|nr:hypothetical protein [Chloroflexota bacterium]
MDLRRSTHPDLLDELESVQPQTSESQPANGSVRARRRRNGAAARPEVSPPGDPAETPVAEEGSGSDESLASEPAAPEPEPPEWLAELQGKTDPLEIIGIARQHASREDLASDPFFQGWIGDLANQRARKMLDDQQRQATEKQRAEAYDRGDLYALGQYAATDLQAQRQLQEQEAQAALNPYMIGIRNFQSRLPEAVQREVQGKNYESYEAYLSAVHDAAIRHGVEEEVKKREPAVRKAELSATVGSEMAPELDGGPAQAYREITDAQVAAMTLEEYERYFDDKGRPKPGVRVSLTRGIDVRREARR